MSDSFSVFARFRDRRLTLRRQIPTLRQAIQFRDEVRALRFHDQENVFIVDDRTGLTVDGPAGVERDELRAALIVERLPSGLHVESTRASAIEALQIALTFTRELSARREDRFDSVIRDIERALARLESPAIDQEASEA